GGGARGVDLGVERILRAGGAQPARAGAGRGGPGDAGASAAPEGARPGRGSGVRASGAGGGAGGGSGGGRAGAGGGVAGDAQLRAPSFEEPRLRADHQRGLEEPEGPLGPPRQRALRRTARSNRVTSSPRSRKQATSSAP